MGKMTENSEDLSQIPADNNKLHYNKLPCLSWNMYRVIKSPAPPYLAKMKNFPGKLSIAFSNTTYLNIIWSFLGFQHLPMTHFSGKSKKSPFSPYFDPKIPLKLHKKRQDKTDKVIS